MIDMEQIAYDLLRETIPEIQWSVGWPQDFRELPVGSINQTDNSVSVSTDVAIDRISSVAVQVQIWAASPEERNGFERRISSAFDGLGLRRGTVNHLQETYSTQITAYRSVLPFSGKYDHKLKIFYLM